MDKIQVMTLLVTCLSILSVVLLLIIFFKKIIIAVKKFWLIFTGYLRHLVRKILRWCIYAFQKMLTKILEKPVFSPIAYRDLAPVNSADPDKSYYRTLEWAIGNRSIHNVALTGPYGSGKSSILRTFQKLNTKEQFLNLSLAAFKDFKADDKIDQVIELSILKQIFYHVRYSSIPDSRFKRIKRQRKRTLAGKSLLFLLWLLTLLFLTKTEYYIKMPRWGDFYKTY
ncbi:MAG: ATP-binding protein, partial [Pedobacter sp.]